MTFFNKKEEVLDIKLTPYGRYLLSLGKLKPSYYCFIDDDVVYDSAAIGVVETQNESNLRIVSETPKLKTRVNACGVDTLYKEMESPTVLWEDVRKAQNERKIDRFPNKLGRSTNVSNRTPAMSVNFLNSEISSSSHYYTGPDSIIATGSISETINIPQIDVTAEYYVAVDKLGFGESDPVATDNFYDPLEGFNNLDLSDDKIISRIYPDDTYFKITPTIPLIHFKELNSFNFKENFSIEVFELEEGGNVPKYKSLKFASQQKAVIDDMLVDSPSQEVEEINESDFVDYYFSIYVDDQIPPEEICKYTQDGNERNIYLDDDIECPDTDPISRFDIYGTRVSPSDLEKCD